MKSLEWVREMTAEVLQQVVAGVKEAREAGVDALMPDVVVFQVELPQMMVEFEVPLEEREEDQREMLEKAAAKMNYSLPLMPN